MVNENLSLQSFIKSELEAKKMKLNIPKSFEKQGFIIPDFRSGEKPSYIFHFKGRTHNKNIPAAHFCKRHKIDLRVAVCKKPNDIRNNNLSHKKNDSKSDEKFYLELFNIQNPRRLSDFSGYPHQNIEIHDKDCMLLCFNESDYVQKPPSIIGKLIIKKLKNLH